MGDLRGFPRRHPAAAASLLWADPMTGSGPARTVPPQTCTKPAPRTCHPRSRGAGQTKGCHVRSAPSAEVSATSRSAPRLADVSPALVEDAVVVEELATTVEAEVMIDSR